MPEQPQALTREQVVDAVLAKIEAYDQAKAAHDTGTGDLPGEDVRDRLLAEIYATCYQLEDALASLTKMGPAGIMGMMFGARKKGRNVATTSEEDVEQTA